MSAPSAVHEASTPTDITDGLRRRTRKVLYDNIIASIGNREPKTVALVVWSRCRTSGGRLASLLRRAVLFDAQDLEEVVRADLDVFTHHRDDPTLSVVQDRLNQLAVRFEMQ